MEPWAVWLSGQWDSAQLAPRCPQPAPCCGVTPLLMCLCHERVQRVCPPSRLVRTESAVAGDWRWGRGWCWQPLTVSTGGSSSPSPEEMTPGLWWVLSRYSCGCSGSPEWGCSSGGSFLHAGVLTLCVVCFPGVSRLQANLKKFMEYVQMLNVEKVCRLLEKGLDPNFHDPDTGGEAGF